MDVEGRGGGEGGWEQSYSQQQQGDPNNFFCLMLKAVLAHCHCISVGISLIMHYSSVFCISIIFVFIIYIHP